MILSLRPILSIVMCWVLAVGHVPGWVHAVTCCGQEPSDRSLRDVQPCGCSLQIAETKSEEASLAAHVDDFVPPHDSDSCAVCRSLAAPNGFADADVPLAIHCAAVPVPVVHSPLIVVVRVVVLPPLRGPPAPILLLATYFVSTF